ncbi:hypothetical protein [Mycetohabitans sp. B8]|uniref:hypothetical protein n=1 Tax=Mycetohabitans sp. B8 TaxID=2841845 RepID=UPI001F25F5C3|nr:hypothetical protein [Mycetohabitans sp. B8]
MPVITTPPTPDLREAGLEQDERRTCARPAVLARPGNLQYPDRPDGERKYSANQSQSAAPPCPQATLRWHRTEFAPTEQHAFLHGVYVGVANVDDLARLVLQGILSNNDLSERKIQRMNGQRWLAAFVVNKHGVPLPRNYLAASFTHGVHAFRETGVLDNVNARRQNLLRAESLRR